MSPSVEPHSEVAHLLETAVAFYSRQLFNHAYAMRYLLKERRITRRTIREMRLGLAHRDTLAIELERSGISLSLAEEMGLLMRGGAGEFLHHRVIFPVLNEHGQPVFMIGRTLNQWGEPKYLNLPNTELLSRRPMIFGKAIDGWIVVEGAVDAAALRQWGLHHRYLTVALLGVGHRGVIETLTSAINGQPIYLALDQDNAGKEATLIMAETLTLKGANVRVLVDQDRYAKAETLANSLLMVSSASQQGELGKRILAAQRHAELVDTLQSMGWTSWVTWAGYKDAADLLSRHPHGHAAFMAGLKSGLTTDD